MQRQAVRRIQWLRDLSEASRAHTRTGDLRSAESGDRLTREEFHQRYCLRTDIAKAELVGGVVYVSSPARHGFHARQQNLMILWLSTYAARRSNLEATQEATIFLDAETEVQPDVALLRLDAPNASIHLDDKGYLHGVPDLIVEIAASSAAYDLYDKRERYRRAGVPEYIAWDVYNNTIIWLQLRNGEYRELEPHPDGMIESARFPGLRLPVAPALAFDRAAVLAALGDS